METRASAENISVTREPVVPVTAAEEKNDRHNPVKGKLNDQLEGYLTLQYFGKGKARLSGVSNLS